MEENPDRLYILPLDCPVEECEAEIILQINQLRIFSQMFVYFDIITFLGLIQNWFVEVVFENLVIQLSKFMLLQSDNLFCNP